MIVTTADVIPGQAVQVLGLVRGNIVTSKNIGRDLMAGVKSIVGGEIVSYTQMTDEARQVAEDRMVAAAQNLGADAVIAMRFASDSIAEGTIEILAYGTAVKLASTEYLKSDKSCEFGGFETPNSLKSASTAGHRAIVASKTSR